MFRFKVFADRLASHTQDISGLIYPHGREVFTDYYHPEARCFYCGILTVRNISGKGSNPDGMRTMDHVIPKIRRPKGSCLPKVVACVKCNTFKGSFTLEEFRLFVAIMLNKPIEDVKFPGEFGT